MMERRTETILISAIIVLVILSFYHWQFNRVPSPVVYVTNAGDVIENLQEKALAGQMNRDTFLKILKNMESQIAELSHRGQNIVLSRKMVVAGGHVITFSPEGIITENSGQKNR
ncbi:Uncharacterized protein dnl_10490 [Desulfonema limicola]|uniref:Uncharacterized protein n=1 Tax=Desulfonema limicola TaxID=45656 RepID=A0A975GF45_9BACT|nr:hypothetical protein [Desulfonema limicola]QTA78810.1 Uncharacterized protein dnl_10490 [Desulfonema limicola]